MDDNEAEFLAVVYPYHALLQMTAWRYTSRGDMADDLVQETLLRAWRGWPPPTRAHIKGWLLTILRNLWINLLRQPRPPGGRHALPLPSASPAPEVWLASLSGPLTRWTLDDVEQDAWSTMPSLWQEAFWLFAVEGESYAEIAQAQHCPRNTIGVRIHRAKTQLRVALTTRATA